MDLKSGYPFWTVKNGLMNAFSPLLDDVRCDVAILGAGVTGALIAREFSQHGHSVCVLDYRDVGWGSTSASTALLQYEIDTHMVDMAKTHGEASAALAYRSCVEAIAQIEQIALDVRDVDFARRDSLYYASRRRDRTALDAEFRMRRKHGIDVQWLDAEDIRDRFAFDAPCAILSADAACIDPYRLTHRLLSGLARHGARIHDRSPLEHISANRSGVQLVAKSGAVVNAGHLVIAAGYETQTFLDRRYASNRSSYAFITDPIPSERLGPLRGTLLWESARPYLYLRTTGDNRLLVGGEDDAVDIPAKRDAAVAGKVRRLCGKVRELFPELPLEPAFAWAGTFAETDDGLPWFGPNPQTSPRVLYAMAYGGNGIVYSALGAGILRSHVERSRHPLKRLFGFERGG